VDLATGAARRPSIRWSDQLKGQFLAAQQMQLLVADQVYRFVADARHGSASAACEAALAEAGGETGTVLAVRDKGPNACLERASVF